MTFPSSPQEASGCPGDPIECGYGAALGQAEEIIAKLNQQLADTAAMARRARENHDRLYFWLVNNAPETIRDDGVTDAVLGLLQAGKDSTAEVLRQADEIEELRSVYGELADLAQRLNDRPLGSASDDFLAWVEERAGELTTIIGPMLPEGAE